MTTPDAPRYGWNAYAGRVYHLLTGERNGARRLVTVCGRAIRGGAAVDLVPAGYTLCTGCARLSR